MGLDQIQPSQLYISAAKLAKVRQEYDWARPESLEPIPMVRLCGKTVYTDGHTRAFAAFTSGLAEIPVYWDRDELDWQAYEICVDWCEQEGIHTIADLAGRVVSLDVYQELWLDRCARLHRRLAAQRRQASDP